MKICLSLIGMIDMIGIKIKKKYFLGFSEAIHWFSHASVYTHKFSFFNVLISIFFSSTNFDKTASLND